MSSLTREQIWEKFVQDVYAGLIVPGSVGPAGPAGAAGAAGATGATGADSDAAGFFSAGSSGAALTIDWSNGRKQRLTLTANCTLTLANPVDGARYLLVVYQNGAGGNTLAWPSSAPAVQWPGSVTPVMTAAANRADLYVLIYVAAATTYYAQAAQSYGL